jgi:3-oxoadipate CoA-transferase alpha subunit
MINKIVRTMAEALDGIKDGSTVLIGGFGSVGQPDALIEALIETGVKNLTIALNNAGSGHVGVAKLMEVGSVRKIICSFPRSSDPVVFETLYREGKLELEITPQGTLAERIRAAAAGIPAFFTATGAGTLLARGKESRVIDGREYILETALKADVALVEAWQADRWGNLLYRGSGANFNPVMAAAAELTVAQVQHIVELGDLHPHMIGTPGVYVNRVIQVDRGEPWTKPEEA